VDEVLVVFCENLLEIILCFVVGRSKLPIFVGQILNSIVAIMLGQREWMFDVSFVARIGISVGMMKLKSLSTEGTS